MSIWKARIHQHRDVNTWLRDWTFPSGMVQDILKLEKKPPTEDLLKGQMILVKKGQNSVVASVLASLAEHADMADSFPVWQALDGIRGRAWHEPSEMSVQELLQHTDILCLHSFDALGRDDQFRLDREIMVRAYGKPKVTILLGDNGRRFTLTIKAYEDRVIGMK